MRAKKRTILTSIMILLLAAASHGESIYDLESCIELALTNNLQLEREQLDLRGAAEAADNSWSHILPSIGLELRADYSRSLLFDSVIGGAAGDPFRIPLRGSVNFQFSHGSVAAIRKTAHSYRLAEISYEQARRDIQVQVGSSFYQLILAEKRQELLAEDLRLAEEQLEQSRIRFDNGIIGERGLLQSRLGVESARLALSKSEADYEFQHRSFLNLLGLEHREDIRFEGEIDPEPIILDAEQLIAEHLHLRGDLRSSAIETELRRIDSRTAKLDRGPSVSLSAGWLQSNANLLEEAQNWQDSLELSLSARIPIDPWIPGSRGDQNLRSAKREEKKAALSQQALINSAELEIRNLAGNLEQARRSMEISTLQLEIAERSFELNQAGFERGTVERLELEESRKELLSARIDLLEGKYHYLVGLIELRRALGTDILPNHESQ
ncbi:MAG TPA: TolC family protein [Sediminispirochaeta sp.]|nr:TolC family protein [Sediminispirochaeta sp.]